MSTDTQPSLATLKAGGLMKQKQADLFSIRLRVVGGYVGAEQLAALAALSAKYGSGHVHLTTRQGIEIPNVRYGDIESLRAELTQAGLETGSCGRRVRTITACQGALCIHGLFDPQALAQTVAARVREFEGLPHKFKLGITGCPNGCIKPGENDLGIMGLAVKEFDPELCNHCGLCLRACPVEEVLREVETGIEWDQERCLQCGACVIACPTRAWQQVGVAYALFAGGKMGKFPRLADRLPLAITDEQHLLLLIDAVIGWFAQHGASGERFGATLDRLGAEALTAHLLTIRPA